jgi:ADP-ribose pyrophosphatase YjhB (NUDIX family)
MEYCNRCGQRTEARIPAGEDRPRRVCTACSAIHYENPRMIVGCIVLDESQRVLLCKRAIEPRRGYWTIPAGFMEVGETLQQAAARECMEEALARVEVGSLCAVVHVLHAEQVHVMFRSTLANPGYGVGPESLETVLCHERDIPWPELAFRSVEFTLRRYLEDRAAGREGLHYHTLD